MERINGRATSIFLDCENVSGIDLHRKFCDCLLREIFKTTLDLNPSYMNSAFPRNDTGSYCLRNASALARKPIHSSKHGLQTISYIGSRLWESLPESIRSLPDESSFFLLIRYFIYTCIQKIITFPFLDSGLDLLIHMCIQITFGFSLLDSGLDLLIRLFIYNIFIQKNFNFCF